MKANKAREALQKIEGVKSVEVDSTSTAVFVMNDDKLAAGPSKDKVTEVLKGQKLSLKTLEKIERSKPSAVFEVTIDGVE